MKIPSLVSKNSLSSVDPDIFAQVIEDGEDKPDKITDTSQTTAVLVRSTGCLDIRDNGGQGMAAAVLLKCLVRIYFYLKYN